MRRLWIVLLLAAVVSMHGVPGLAAGPGAGALSGSVQFVGHSLHGGEPDGAPAAGGTSDARSDAGVPGHGAAAHALSLCLAVLLAGVALFAAASVVRTRTPAAAGDPTPRRTHRPRLPCPRGPDLSALCLLRI